VPECPFCGKFIEVILHGTEDAKDLKEDLKDLKSKSKTKIYYGDFVQLTVDEFNKLLEKFGKEGTRSRIDRLDNYIGSVGRQYKSHYHTILNWAVKDMEVLEKRREPECACGQPGRFKIGNERLCIRCFRARR